MTRCTATHRDNAISVRFSAAAERADYGVPGSPTWLEPRPGTVEITQLEILGVEVKPRQLPEELWAAILALADEIDHWEKE